MGNLLLVLIFASFSWGASLFSARTSLALTTSLFHKGKFPTYKRAWLLGLSMTTFFILLAFVVMGLLLPSLLSLFFAQSSDVSSSVLALGILFSLCLAWLWALNRLRFGLDELPWPEFDEVDSRG